MGVVNGCGLTHWYFRNVSTIGPLVTCSIIQEKRANGPLVGSSSYSTMVCTYMYMNSYHVYVHMYIKQWLIDSG